MIILILRIPLTLKKVIYCIFERNNSKSICCVFICFECWIELFYSIFAGLPFECSSCMKNVPTLSLSKFALRALQIFEPAGLSGYPHRFTQHNEEKLIFHGLNNWKYQDLFLVCWVFLKFPFLFRIHVPLAGHIVDCKITTKAQSPCYVAGHTTE